MRRPSRSLAASLTAIHLLRECEGGQKCVSVASKKRLGADWLAFAMSVRADDLEGYL